MTEGGRGERLRDSLRRIAKAGASALLIELARGEGVVESDRGPRRSRSMAARSERTQAAAQARSAAASAGVGARSSTDWDAALRVEGGGAPSPNRCSHRVSDLGFRG